MKKTVLAVVAASLLTAAPGLCDNAALRPPELLDREAALAAAAKVTAKKYPDAEEVLVAGIQKIEYEADGTYVQWHEEYVKILTEESRRGHLTLESYFTIPYQRGPEDCRIVQVEIIRPDGKVMPIDVAAESRVMVNPSSMEENIYNPNDQLIQVNISDLQIGDVLHYVLYDRIVKPRVEKTWSEWLVFEGLRPMLKQVVEISGPEELPLRAIAHKSEIPGTVAFEKKEADGRIIWRWEAKDVPRMFPEPSMPPPHTVIQRVLVSTIPDWETISRWYWNLSEPHFKAGAALEEKVQELTSGLENPREKTWALFKFVSQEVRYMGITKEAESPGYEPHDVMDTFEALHGVCRDKAALLVAMLRLAGMDAYPTLIHNGAKLDSEVPQPYFNHAIVAVKNNDGEIILMDPTDETTTELLPAYLSDKSYLVASPEGEPLRTSPIVPAAENMMMITTTGRVDAAGGLVAETVLEFRGANDNAYRGLFATRKPEERRQFFEGLAKSMAPGASVSSLSIVPEDMTDTSTTLTVRIAFSASDLPIGREGTVALPLPQSGSRLGVANFIVGQTGLKTRKYPLVTGMACGVSETMSIELDSSFSTAEALPRGPLHETDALLWSLNSSMTGRVIEASARFVLKGVEFSPQEYLELKKTLKQIELDYRKIAILRKEASAAEAAALPAPAAEDGNVAADSEILETSLEYELANGSNWTETSTMKEKILTYAGKKDSSEIKIGYNEAWESVELEYARVTAPDGAVKEISSNEVNIMDAPWVGAVPRYPKGKILVISLPAVEVDSVVEYRIRRECRDRPFFSVMTHFRDLRRIQQQTVRISAPTNLPLKILTQNVAEGAVRHTEREESGRRIHEWVSGPAEPVKQEDSLPPWWTFNPVLFVSSGNWPEYAAMINEKLTAAASGQTQTVAQVEKIIAGAEDKWEQLERIRDFAALNNREAGPGLGVLPLSSISPADDTLRSGYGNSPDRAILHYTLLKAAGFDPEFVLVSSLPMIEQLNRPFQECPVMLAFTEVVVRLRDSLPGVETNRHVYFNDTTQYDAVGASAAEGQLGIFLSSASFGEILPARPTSTETISGIDLRDDGSAVISRKHLLYGRDFGDNHQLFAEMQPEERRRYFRELIASVSQAAESEGDLFTDFDRYPGVVEYAVWVPDYAVLDGDFFYFPLPDSPGRILPMRADRRVNPFYFPTDSTRSLQADVTWPEGYSVHLAPEAMREDNVAGLPVSVQLESRPGAGENSWRMESIVSVKPAVAPASDYPIFLELDRKMAHRRNRFMLLKKGE
ncbi:MAG: DUF3857 domain-containing protein [Kiritimatiellia bacterium]